LLPFPVFLQITIVWSQWILAEYL
jgi:hypothetical protein